MNNVTLIGRLTKDPILKKTQSGASVTSFHLAVNRDYQKENQPTTDFISCVAWNKTADIICQYLKKGNRVGLKGRIETRSYDDQSGRTVYITEVIAERIDFLETVRKEQDSQIPVPSESQSNELPPIPDFASSNTLDIASDDLPF